MLTNPLPPLPAAQPDGDRPQLRIAARATPDARQAPPTAAALIASEVGSWHAESRATLETFKAALTGLEQSCQSAMAAQESRVSDLIERLVQGAAAEAAALAAQTRDQAQVTITELQQASMALQATVKALQAALEEERENVKRLTAQLDREGAVAEALRADLQAHQSEVASVRSQLQAAAAERSKLAATFRLVQRAMALSNPILSVPADGSDESMASGAESEPALQTVAPTVAPVESEPVAPSPAASVDSQHALIEAHPGAAEQMGEILAQLETMYHEDAETGWGGIEMADRLTANLRHARSLCATRWSDDSFDALPLFDHLVSQLLDRHAGTAFARHLGIAAYTLRTQS